ncbi:MAG: sn-glycerol-3-phosphate dehydrogenase subunit C [Syntrophobacterales bacterium RBG_19FT_COMBO_59_10]|nr:MAG: sn-glycerol-3-phosphate dehydrogenase subunit C [Syntrophobacterales bacterium RBG_19FT_COMBO_59_10]
MTQENDTRIPPRTFPDVCVRCATCMAACPVSRVTPRFPGPKQAGPGAQRFRSASEASVDDWIELCTSCRLCDTVCPAGVPISELNLMAKAKYLDERGRTFRDWLLVRSDLFGELASRYATKVNPLLKNRTVRRLLDALFGIDRRRDLPAYETPTFRQWFGGRETVDDDRPKIGYFYGCFTNTNETDVGKAAVALLEAHGFSVVVPPQRCCGIPRLGVGDLRGAREMGKRNIDLLLPTVREGIDIVFSSTSCGLMLRHEYGRLLNLTGAGELAERLFDLCDFLLRLHQEGRAAASFRPLPMKAAYFAPCHLRPLNIGLPALELLRLVPELDVRPVEAECCGLGGLYGFRKEKFAIAEEIGKDLTGEIARMKPEIILTDCEGCRMQLRHLTGLKVLHPAQLIRNALP